MKITLSAVLLSLLTCGVHDIFASHGNCMNISQDALAEIDNCMVISDSPRGINRDFSPVPSHSVHVKHIPVRASSVHIDAANQLISRYEAEGRCIKNLEKIRDEFVSLHRHLDCADVNKMHTQLSTPIAHKSFTQSDSLHVQIVKEKLADSEISRTSKEFYEKELADLTRYHK